MPLISNQYFEYVNVFFPSSIHSSRMLPSFIKIQQICCIFKNNENYVGEIRIYLLKLEYFGESVLFWISGVSHLLWVGIFLVILDGVGNIWAKF